MNFSYEPHFSAIALVKGESFPGRTPPPFLIGVRFSQ